MASVSLRFRHRADWSAPSTMTKQKRSERSMDFPFFFFLYSSLSLDRTSCLLVFFSFKWFCGFRATIKCVLQSTIKLFANDTSRKLLVPGYFDRVTVFPPYLHKVRRRQMTALIKALLLLNESCIHMRFLKTWQV